MSPNAGSVPEQGVGGGAEPRRASNEPDNDDFTIAMRVSYA